MDGLDDFENDYPGWHAWVGVSGDLFYARRLRSSPPIVFRAGNLDDLRKQVQEHLRATGSPPAAPAAGLLHPSGAQTRS